MAGTEMALVGGCRHVYYLVRRGGVMAIVEAARRFYISQPFALMGVVLGRVSVGLLLLRIIGQSVWRRGVIWACIGTSLVFGVLNCILLFAACRPAEAVWNPFVQGAVCWDPTVVTKVTIAFSAWNVLVDFVLALLPASIFWPLKLSREKRVALIALLGGGVFAGVCGAVKASYLPSANSDDVTWATYDLLLWHGAEYFLVVVLGSLPTLKPIWDLARGRRRTATAGRSSYYSYPRREKRSQGSSNWTESSTLHSSAAPQLPGAALPKPQQGITVAHRVDVETWDDGGRWLMWEEDRRHAPYGGPGRGRAEAVGLRKVPEVGIPYRGPATGWPEAAELRRQLNEV